MLDTFKSIFKWLIILAVSIALFFIFIHVVFPIIAIAIIAGIVYYFYKKNHLARERAKYTPEGRKKVN